MATHTKEKITDQNMAHHNRYTKEQGTSDAHQIYLSNFAGDVATISHENSPSAGYPQGSVAPFMLDHTGQPIIFTASIAQHTQNAIANPRTSLMMRQVEKNHEIETGWRLTVMGDLLPTANDERKRISNRYFCHYPHAELYEKTHDFDFYRLHVKKARIIMGFGRIAWVDAEALVHNSPFDEASEESILQHMNADHVDAMTTYLKNNHVDIKPNAKPPTMVAINQFGVTIRYRKRLHFVAFANEAHDVMSAREQLVNLAKA